MHYLKLGRRHLRGGVLVLLALSGVTVAFVGRGDGAPEMSASANPVHTAGRILYVDPETGERTAPPPGLAGAQLHQTGDRSDAGLVEEALPGGGFRVDLQGRFKSVRRKVIRQDGTIAYACDHGAGVHEGGR